MILVILEGGATNPPCEGFREDELGLEETGEGPRTKDTWAEEGEIMTCWGGGGDRVVGKDLLKHHPKESEPAT